MDAPGCILRAVEGWAIHELASMLKHRPGDIESLSSRPGLVDLCRRNPGVIAIVVSLLSVYVVLASTIEAASGANE